MVKCKVFLFAMLAMNICVAFSQKINNLQVAYENLVTWFNPCMGDAHMHYPLFGSAQVSSYTVKDGKLVSYEHESRVESNGMDYFIYTYGTHSIEYSDSVIVMTCKGRRVGNRSGLISKGTHSHAYPIGGISLIDDSTAYFPETKWTLTASKHCLSNSTGNENDLWNVEVAFDKKGFPIKIKRGKSVICFKYLKFDDFGNWTEREMIYEDGRTWVQARSIEYTCEECGGKGVIRCSCPACHGTGRTRINRNGGPDESVGICSRCSGHGNMIVKCQHCN